MQVRKELQVCLVRHVQGGCLGHPSNEPMGKCSWGLCWAALTHAQAAVAIELMGVCHTSHMGSLPSVSELLLYPAWLADTVVVSAVTTRFVLLLGADLAQALSLVHHHRLTLNPEPLLRRVCRPSD